MSPRPAWPLAGGRDRARGAVVRSRRRAIGGRHAAGSTPGPLIVPPLMLLTLTLGCYPVAFVERYRIQFRSLHLLDSVVWMRLGCDHLHFQLNISAEDHAHAQMYRLRSPGPGTGHAGI